MPFFFAVCNSAFGLQVLVVKGKSKIFAKSLTIGSIVGLSGCIAGTYLFGTYGAIGGMTLGKFLTFGLIWSGGREYFSQIHFAKMVPVLYPSFCMASALYFANLNGLWWNLALGGIIYLVFLFIFNRGFLKQLFVFYRKK